MTSESWLWLDTALMLAGGLAILAVGKQRTAGEQAHTIFHGIVPIIAACSYFAMAVGQGSTLLPLSAPAGTGRVFYYARYIDWTFTTPLLLVALSLTAIHSGLRRGGMVAGLVLADVLMILTALFFGASEVAWIKWTWFGISCAAFLGVYYVMAGPMLAENRKETADVQSAYRREAVILSVLWLIYPLLLAISEDGLGLIGTTAGVAAFAIIDFVSKVAYGLMSVTSAAKLTGRSEVRMLPGGRMSYGTAD